MENLNSRTIRMTNPMAETNLSKKEMQQVIIWIGPWLKAADLTETEGMEVIRANHPVFSQALTVLGVFD